MGKRGKSKTIETLWQAYCHCSIRFSVAYYSDYELYPTCKLLQIDLLITYYRRLITVQCSTELYSTVQN